MICYNDISSLNCKYFDSGIAFNDSEITIKDKKYLHAGFMQLFYEISLLIFCRSL